MLIALKYAQANFAMTVFNFNWNSRGLSQSSHYTELGHFILIVVFQKTVKKCIKITASVSINTRIRNLCACENDREISI